MVLINTLNMKTNNNPDISIIIVHYNTLELLQQCLDSILLESKNFSYEIIVVDNASSNNPKEIILKRYPDIVWIDAGYNSGFSRGNNMGLRHAKGEYGILLNSDTILERNALFELLIFYKKKQESLNLGLLGCRLVDEKKELLIGSHIGFPRIYKALNANSLVVFTRKKLGQNIEKNKAKSRLLKSEFHSKNHSVDIVSGACVFFNIEKLKKHDLYLDEDFFLYSEDVEWSHRYKKYGFKNYFLAETEIVHKNAGSSSIKENTSMQINLSEWLLFMKIYGKIAFILYAAILSFNFLLDNFFQLKNKIFKRASPVQYRTLNKTYKLFFKNIPIILLSFKRKTSSAKNYLRYHSTKN